MGARIGIFDHYSNQEHESVDAFQNLSPHRGGWLSKHYFAYQTLRSGSQGQERAFTMGGRTRGWRYATLDLP
jgi:hypothetical protein